LAEVRPAFGRSLGSFGRVETGEPLRPATGTFVVFVSFVVPSNGAAVVSGRRT